MIRPHTLLLSVVLVVAGWGVSAAGTSYFVTQSGAGMHDGLSSASAWSVANYNASSAPTGGDTVFFSGTITSQVTPNSSGTGNGPGRLTLYFSGATLSVSGTQIQISARSFLTVSGGPISTAGAGNDLINFNQQQSHDVTIQNFTYTGPAGGTGHFMNSRFCNNLLVQNNTIDNVEGAINSDGATNGVTILNNFFLNQRKHRDSDRRT